MKLLSALVIGGAIIFCYLIMIIMEKISNWRANRRFLKTQKIVNETILSSYPNWTPDDDLNPDDED
jgi:hypothetical protein